MNSFGSAGPVTWHIVPHANLKSMSLHVQAGSVRSHHTLLILVIELDSWGDSSQLQRVGRGEFRLRPAGMHGLYWLGTMNREQHQKCLCFLC